MKLVQKHDDLKDIDRLIKQELPSLPAEHRESGWPRTLMRLAAAVAAIVVAGVIASVFRWPSDRLAVVESVDGALYRLGSGTTQTIHAGETIRPREAVRANGGAGAMLRLTDGSRVEVRSQSELSLEHA